MCLSGNVYVFGCGGREESVGGRCIEEMRPEVWVTGMVRVLEGIQMAVVQQKRNT